MSHVPIIKPRNITEYEYKQSKYPHVPKIPFRSIIVASSTGGKTVLIQNLILDVYRDCFSRIFIFSPSVHTDPTFVEVKKYIRNGLKVDDTKEDIYFQHYSPEELERVIETQTKIVTYMKDHKLNKLHSILIVVDDHADDLNFVRHSKLLHGLATRGRHQAISFILSTCEYLVTQLTTKQPLYSCAVKYLFLSVRQLIRLVTLWLKSKSASGTVCFQMVAGPKDPNFG